MAFDTVPWIIDGTTIDAETIRRALGTLIGPAGGIVTPGDLAVTAQATPNMSVAIGPGQIWVPGSSTPTQGPYYGHNGAAVTQPITASNPSLPRVDTITVQVQDQVYAGSLKQLAPGYVLGTPTSGANISTQAAAASYAGALPASSYVLAYVLVPAAATSITTGDILNVAATSSLKSAGLTVTGNAAVGGTLTVGGVSVTPTILNATGSMMAAPGDVIDTVPGATITLPSASGSFPLPITIIANGGVSGASPVTVAGTNIYGVGLSAASSFLLGTPNASVTLMPLNGVWLIISGQQDTGWVAFPSLTSPLVSGAGGGGAPPRYRLTGDRVLLDGQFSNPSGSAFANATMATLPAGYRPPYARAFTVYYGGSTAPVGISTGGGVSAGVGAGAYLNLDGISYTTS